ncbi:MAG: hypothetical protein LBG96_04880 [Tannerella sp.]|jgi:squalene cyclase|nr:hypothetical protein [Tannerella sp.]
MIDNNICNSPNGGWSTYYDNEIKKRMHMPLNSDFTGWFSPQMCVTGVSAWVLKDIAECNELYNTTINYIVNNQNNNGCWKSYWWTENIYATAFCIFASTKLDFFLLNIRDLRKENKQWVTI